FWLKFAASVGGGALAGVLVFFGPPFFQPFRSWYFAQCDRLFSYPWTASALLEAALVIAALLLATIALHEGAHALVGSAVGFRVRSLRVGRLQIDRPFRLSIFRGAGTGAGGLVTLLPMTAERLAPRAVAITLAGPLANLVSGCAVLLLPYAEG